MHNKRNGIFLRYLEWTNDSNTRSNFENGIQLFAEGNSIIERFILGVNFLLFYSYSIILIYVDVILFGVNDGLM
jgi:hypothetical protein